MLAARHDDDDILEIKKLKKYIYIYITLQGQKKKKKNLNGKTENRVL